MSKVEGQDHGFPRKRDRFFKVSSIGQNTVFALNKHERSQNLIAGYREAAELLAVKVEDGRGFDDNLVFPLIFIYRHVFELSMKEIIEIGGWRANIVLTNRNHRLMPLWDIAQKVLSSMELEDWGVQDVHIGKLLDEINSIDPESFSFRYHTNKSDKLIDLNHYHVDLVNFIETARRLSSYFDRITSELHMRVQYLLSAMSEKGSD